MSQKVGTFATSIQIYFKMSKTYHRNRNMEFLKNLEPIEENAISWPSCSFDGTFIRLSLTRHPKGTRGKGLNKAGDFKSCNVKHGWRHISGFGEMHDQSSRCHKIKASGTGIRRQLYKMQANEAINRALIEQ